MCLLFSMSIAHGQWTSNDSKNGILITYNYQKYVSGKDTSLLVNIVINDNPLNQPANYGTISLTSNNVLNRDSLSILLKAKYASIFNQFGKETLLRHGVALEQMVTSIKDTINKKNLHSFVFQGICIFKSLLMGAERDNNVSGNVDFTIFGGYENAINSFVCEQEIVINIIDFRNYLTNRKQSDSSNVGIDYYLGALQDVTAISLNQFEINQKLTSYFLTTQGRAAWPQGGQCGCCGNYSGNCYYWSSVCLGHDMACQQCQHSWCFSGCVPSSCSGNTIAWYWWLV